MRKIIRLDCSAEDVIVLCDQCTWRGGPAAGRVEARALGRRHRRDVHPNQAGSRRVRRLLAVRP